MLQFRTAAAGLTSRLPLARSRAWQGCGRGLGASRRSPGSLCCAEKSSIGGRNEDGAAALPGEVVRKSALTVTASLAAPRRWLIGEPDFRRLWLVGLVVFSVRWLEMLAVAVFAYQHTGSPFIV